MDFLRRRVRVERKIVESGKLIVGEPKTKRSRRWVSIPEPIALTLSEHVRLYAKDDSLFPGPEGGPLRRKTFRRAWTGANESAGIAGFRFRNLRHSGATWGPRGRGFSGPGGLPPGPLHHPHNRTALRAAGGVDGRRHCPAAR